MLPIRQIDPYASSTSSSCSPALFPVIGIEMGSSTIQIGRFSFPHNQIDHSVLDVCTTKKSSTSQLRRWKPQTNPTVLLRMPHVFPTDIPQQFNNPFHPQNNDPSTANQIDSISYATPPLLRFRAFNMSNTSPFHIDPSKPIPIHVSHDFCLVLFSFPLNATYSWESSRSTTLLLFRSKPATISFSLHSPSLPKESHKRERWN